MNLSKDFSEQWAEIFKAREGGDFTFALTLLNILEAAFQDSGDNKSLVRVETERAANLRHQYKVSKNLQLLEEAWNALARAEKLVTPPENALTFWQAQVLFEQKNYQAAKEKYSAALAGLDTNTKNGQYGDYQTHLGVVTFLLGGEAAGMELVDQGIKLLLQEKATTDDYNHKVWLSGAYIRQAKLLALQGEKEQARTALAQAHAIIEADERLEIRRTHLAEAAQFIEQENPTAAEAFS